MFSAGCLIIALQNCFQKLKSDKKSFGQLLFNDENLLFYRKGILFYLDF